MYQVHFLKPRDSGGFQDQCKKWKNEDFGIGSIIPTTMIFKSFILFSCLFLCAVVLCSEIGFKTCLLYTALFLRFLH